MDASTRSIPQLMIPLLVVIAIAGYLLGIKHVSTPSAVTPGESSRVAYGASVQLRYPAGWRQSSEVPTIPGLSLSHLLVLAPGGKATNSGLISGQLPRDVAGPLPTSFVSLLGALPHTEVVELLNVQAYRYTHMSLRGYNSTLELYVVPSSGEGPTALACYAAAGYTADLHQCEETVAKLTLTGVSSFNLNPEAGYAGRLARLVSSLGSERVSLRHQMGSATRPATLASLARRLSSQFDAAASALVELEPPNAAAGAQTALSAAMAHARDGYRRLAVVAEHEQSPRYASARRHVEAAEAGVDQALGTFTLIGYGKS